MRTELWPWNKWKNKTRRSWTFRKRNQNKTKLMYAKTQKETGVTLCSSKPLISSASTILCLRVVRSLKYRVVCLRMSNLNTTFCKNRSKSTQVERAHTDTARRTGLQHFQHFIVEYSTLIFVVKTAHVLTRESCNKLCLIPKKKLVYNWNNIKVVSTAEHTQNFLTYS